MLRIALVIPTLDRSGAEKQLTWLATGLPRDRFEPHVIALTRGGGYAAELNSADVPVTVIGKRLKLDPLTIWKLRRQLADFQPDVVHSWLFAANAYTRLFAPASTRKSAKFVVSERCVDSWKSGWQLALDRRLVTRTDRLVGNSQAVADFYRELGFDSARLAVIPNAVSIPPRPSISQQELKQQLHWPADARIIMYAGRLAPQKRVRDLLWSCQFLRQADPRTRLLVIGDGPERDALLYFAKQIEVEDFVTFTGHRDDAASLLQLADVFWLASEFEGMSNSLMEAMACGKPVVVSDIAPNRELVRHEREGFLAGIGDGVAFAQFTRRLFDDPSLSATIGAAAAERMARLFSREAMVRSYATLYEAITTEHAK
ncbi:MAG: glycosyltransferase [Planctomycetaceae bacterium]